MLLIADRCHDARGFSGFEDDDDLIGPGAPEIRLDEFITATLGGFEDRSVPRGGLFLDPELKLVGDATQHIPADWIEMPINTEKADHSLGLLEWLGQPVEQDPVKAPIAKADAVLVVLVKGVHDRLPF
jgi:hypothetical protein